MIGRELIGQELQSNVAAQTQVFGLVDHTHAAATQLLQYAVMRNGLASHCRTPCRFIPKTPRDAAMLERRDRQVNVGSKNSPTTGLIRFTSSFATSNRIPIPLFVFLLCSVPSAGELQSGCARSAGRRAACHKFFSASRITLAQFFTTLCLAKKSKPSPGSGRRLS